jgi:hypothetical protein
MRARAITMRGTSPAATGTLIVPNRGSVIDHVPAAVARVRSVGSSLSRTSVDGFRIMVCPGPSPAACGDWRLKKGTFSASSFQVPAIAAADTRIASQAPRRTKLDPWVPVLRESGDGSQRRFQAPLGYSRYQSRSSRPTKGFVARSSSGVTARKGGCCESPDLPEASTYDGRARLAAAENGEPERHRTPRIH